MAKTTSFHDKIEARIERIPIAGCWIWTGMMNDSGYGVFGVRNDSGQPVSIRAHRLSYEEFVGPIPDGLYVLHRCDVRACVNPFHLFLGTQKDNIHDMISKGRSRLTSTANAAKTHCKYGHALTPDRVMRRKNGARICKTCWARICREQRVKKRKNENA